MITILAIGLSSPLWADEMSDLRKRIEDLESRQLDSYMRYEDPKKVSSFFAEKLTIGGFFNGGINGIWGENTKSQVSSTDNILGINLSAALSDKFLFAAQFVTIYENKLYNTHNDPRGDTIGLPKSRLHKTATLLSAVPQSYLEYKYNRMYNLQAGMGFAPFGYILEVREPVLYLRSQGPQITRRNDVFTQLWTGVNLHGSKAVSAGEVGYNAYTFTPPGNSHFLGLGLRSWFANGDESFVSGISAQIAEKENENYKTIGTDFKFTYQDFQLRAEFAEYFSQIAQNSWTAYVEPGLYMYNEEVLLFVFSDYFFNSINKTEIGASNILDPIQSWENGIGLNWLPLSRIRIRFVYTRHNYLGSRGTILGRNRDYDSIDTSIGVSF